MKIMRKTVFRGMINRENLVEHKHPQPVYVEHQKEKKQFITQ